MNRFQAGCLVTVALFVVALVMFSLRVERINSEPVRWQMAHDDDSVQLYEEYLRAFPQGQHASEARGRLATLSAADNKLRDVCSGKGAQEAAPHTPDSAFHPTSVYALEEGHFLNADATIPKAWRPRSVADCQLVACVGAEEKVLLQTCRYTGGSVSTRYGFQRRVVLRAARTAEEVAEDLFAGSEPPECPASITHGNPLNETTRLGGSVDLGGIREWLRRHVNPRAGD